MRSLIFLSFLASLVACSHQRESNQDILLNRDSIPKKSEHSYQPGLGEFMSNLQVHHAKLWFAGINRNWPLADFELGEIRETVDNIREYNQDRPEVSRLSMIDPLIDTVSHSIGTKDEKMFERAYSSLTATCNHCHQATGHGFNVITVPTQPPYSNQDFSAH